jgi:signal transduction histidine kinase
LLTTRFEPVPAGLAAREVAEHVVMFYDDESFLLDSLAGFIAPALLAGQRGVIVATEEHRAGAEARLARLGIDVASATVRGHYISVDARATLARFMVGDSPCAERFEPVLDDLLEGSQADQPARIFGEMVALLAGDGLPRAAIELEALWNRAQLRRSFALLCGYPMATFHGHTRAVRLQDTCDAHTSVIPCESYSALPSREDQLREIAGLQQKAASLECALAAEREARAAAEAALRVRDEFLSTASHELRTPITVVGVQAQVVLRAWERTGKLETERALHALQTIETQTEKVARLVQQLLDVSRLDSGLLSIEPVATDLATLVRQVCSVCQALSEEHRISLSVPEELVVSIDPLRVEQVLTNLLDNAMKYSGRGSAIDIELRRLDGAGAELSVRDHGPGIAPEKREHIFDRFFQADPEDRRGLGLGLYLCRTIVELHGGELTAEFPRDGGTRFCIRLRG